MTKEKFPSIYLPHLPRMIPCSYWALTCLGALPSCRPLYVVPVRQARGLPVVSLLPHPASFRFHLTMDTLAFGCTLPTTGRVRDFHPLETCAAGRTKKPLDLAPRVFLRKYKCGEILLKTRRSAGQRSREAYGATLRLAKRRQRRDC